MPDLPMLTTQNIVLWSTTVTTALIAGLLYAYSCSVNPGLNRLPDASYLAAMQSINREIQNPVFFLSFMGSLVLLPLSTWMLHSQPVSARFWLLLLATIVYGVGVFGVTVAGNVPLNEALNGIELTTATPTNLADCRRAFEQPWNQLHRIRTVLSVATLMLVVAACLSQPAKT